MRSGTATARAVAIAFIALSLLGGCMIRQLASDDHELVYSYGNLDFSGKVWERAKQHCQRTGQRVIHKDTDCDHWFRCVSRFSCQ